MKQIYIGAKNENYLESLYAGTLGLVLRFPIMLWRMLLWPFFKLTYLFVKAIIYGLAEFIVQMAVGVIMGVMGRAHLMEVGNGVPPPLSLSKSRKFDTIGGVVYPRSL